MDYKRGARHLTLITVILGLFQVQNTLGDSVVSLPPSDVVQRVGGNAQFFCKISGLAEDAEAVLWSRKTYLGDGDDELIYKTYLPKPLNMLKYNFTKMAPLETNIVVKDLTYADAGLYKCAPISDSTKGETAELVVVDTPMAEVPEMLNANEEVQLSCGVYFLCSEDSVRQPQLFAMVGSESVTTGEVNSGVQSGKYWKKMIYKGTFDVPQHGQNFTCGARVVHDSIDFTITQSKELHIKHTTTKVKAAAAMQDTYYPGDKINCTGNGYPEPSLTWVPMKSDGAAQVNGGMLIISEEMIGKNVWKCRGAQAGVEVETTGIIFQVVPHVDPQVGESVGADATTVGVAVGVSVALLIGVIAIVIFFVLKKLKARPSRGGGDIEEREGPGTGSLKRPDPLYEPVSTNPEEEDRSQQFTTFRSSDTSDITGRPATGAEQYEVGRSSQI